MQTPRAFAVSSSKLCVCFYYRLAAKNATELFIPKVNSTRLCFGCVESDEEHGCPTELRENDRRAAEMPCGEAKTPGLILGGGLFRAILRK